MVKRLATFSICLHYMNFPPFLPLIHKCPKFSLPLNLITGNIFPTRLHLLWQLVHYWIESFWMGESKQFSELFFLIKRTCLRIFYSSKYLPRVHKEIFPSVMYKNRYKDCSLNLSMKLYLPLPNIVSTHSNLSVIKFSIPLKFQIMSPFMAK